MKTFYYKRNRLFCNNVSVDAIARKTGTPVFIYSKEKILKNLGGYDNAFSGINHLLCYAVKANSNPHILSEIFSRGAGADVTSGGELYRSLKAGVSPRKIVFAGIGKTEAEIEYAVRSGILMFNAESIEEAGVINSVGRRLGARPNVAFRINPNIDPHTHAYITTGKSENKFGIPVSQAPEAYLKAKRHSNIRIAGMHCHIGSQITELNPFILMAKTLARMTAKLRSCGIVLDYIDIGGGLGVRYVDEKPPAPETLADAVLSKIRKHCKTVIMEPGRYIVAESGILVTKVLYRKRSANKNFIVVDAGMTDLIRPTLYGAYHEIIPLVKSGRTNGLPRCRGTAKGLPSDVVGPVCESGDFLGKNRKLPVPRRGDYLAVKNAGAYGFAMSSQYNSRPRAAEVLVDGNKWRIIRRREAYPELDL